MMRSYTIANRMLRGYLLHPYTWFLNHHSAEIGANILGDVTKVTTKALLPAMKVLTYGTVVVGLVALVLVRPMVAFAAAGLLGGSYLLVYALVRKYLHRLGHERHAANKRRFRIAGEALGGIKDGKLLGLEDAFLNRYSKAALQVSRHDATSTILADLPHYLLEAVAFGGMLAFVLYLLVTGNVSLGSILPILALYAFAAIRIFPALQRIYNSLAAIRFSKPTLDRLYEDMKAAEANIRTLPPRAKGAPALHLDERLALEDVHYSYPLADRPALRGMSLAIPARSTVGIVGGTGAGKTTAIDIVLGLLTPDAGRLLVDGTPVTPENMRAWQRSIGYVPQHIFLTDDTVSANVAFGLDAAEIDQAAVERAAKIAEIHDFVLSEMPKGYATPVGERGVRLPAGSASGSASPGPSTTTPTS